MKKRIICLVLASLMLVGTVALTSCQRKSPLDAGIGKGALTTKSLQNIYKAESISTLGTVFENMEINRVYPLKNDKFLVQGYTRDEYMEKYYITDVTFQNASEMPIVKAGGQNTETYISRISVNNADGSIWYIKNVYTYEEPTVDDSVIKPRATNETVQYVGAAAVATLDVAVTMPEVDAGYVSESKDRTYLVKVGENGEIISETDVTEILMITDEMGNSYTGYISAIVFSEGNAVLCFESKITSVNGETGEVVNEITLEEGTYLNEVFVGASGTLYTSSWGDNGMEMKTIDLASGKTTPVEFGFEGDLYNYNYSTGALGYELLLSDSIALYGYNPSDTALTEICNYANSDIDLRYGRSNPIVLSDGRLLLSYYNYDDSTNEVLLLTKVDPAEVKEKYLITVGGTYINYDIKSALMKFNRTNDTYKVVFKDYSSYNSEENQYTGAKDALDKDILSKENAPDIIMMNYDMDLNSYISKGILANIDEFMMADETFNREDYLENVLDAMKVNGKLYTITPSVNFMSLVGKKSIFGDKTHWTMKEFLDMHNSLGEGEQMFAEQTRDNMGEMLLMIAKDEFIEDSGKCNFNSEEFKSILAYLKDIPADYTAYEDLWQDNNNYWVEQELSYSKGTTKLRPLYIYNFDVIPETEAYLGEEPAFIGYPTSGEGSSGALIMLDNEIAVSASSKVTAGAWEVIKYLLSEEQQNKFLGEEGRGSAYSFPLKKSIIEKKIEKDIEPRYYTYTDENGEEVKEEENRTYWIGDQEVELRRSTKEDAERLYEIIMNAHIVTRSDTKFTDIVMSEAAPYFDGQKSVDDVANVINSRIQLMVNE